MDNTNKTGFVSKTVAEDGSALYYWNDALNGRLKDNVNHPSHYTNGKYEVIDIIEDQLGSERFEGFCLGNTIKYICRAGKKDPNKKIEDLKKAKWYLNHLIEKKETEEAKLND